MTYTLINALEEICSQELDSEIWGAIRVKHVGRNSKLGLQSHTGIALMNGVSFFTS